MKYKILFFGSSNFSVEIFKILNSSTFIEIIGVITQKAKPFGRKKEIRPSILKEFLSTNYPQIKVFEPENLKTELEEILNKTNSDYIFVASYGKIIPARFFEKFKFLNLHGSLLPILRGAVPIQMAIIKGFEKTGVTLQLMQAGMDEGDIISQKEVTISDKEDFFSLEKKCIELSKNIILNNLINFFEGKIVPIKQDDSKATYCYIKDLQNIQIDFNNTAISIDRIVRSLIYEGVFVNQFLPCRQAKFQIKLYKINIKNLPELQNVAIGETVIKDKRLFIKAKDQFIEILEMQPVGKKRMLAKDFINGVRIINKY